MKKSLKKNFKLKVRVRKNLYKFVIKRKKNFYDKKFFKIKNKKFLNKIFLKNKRKKIFTFLDRKTRRMIKFNTKRLSRHLTDKLIKEVIRITKRNYLKLKLWWYPISLISKFSNFKRGWLESNLEKFFFFLKRVSKKKLQSMRALKHDNNIPWYKSNYLYYYKFYLKKFFSVKRSISFNQFDNKDISIFVLMHLFYSFYEKKKVYKKIMLKNDKIDDFIDKKDDLEYDFEEKFLKFIWKRIKVFSYKNLWFIRKKRDKLKFIPNPYLILTLRKTISNLFLTINSRRGRLLYVASTGLIADNNSKKTKNSPMLVGPVMSRLKKALDFYKIKLLVIHIKCKITSHIYNVIKFLKKGNYKFKYIAYLRPMPHHFGQRTKKLRRL